MALMCQEYLIFLKCHRNVNKQTNLSVDDLIINKSLGNSEPSRRIMHMKCQDFSSCKNKKMFKKMRWHAHMGPPGQIGVQVVCLFRLTGYEDLTGREDLQTCFTKVFTLYI